MNYKCKLCGVNDVYNDGDICEFCAMKNKDCALDTVSPEKSNNTYIPKRSSGRKILINGIDSESEIDNSSNTSPVSKMNKALVSNNKQSKKNSSNQPSGINQSSQPKSASRYKTSGIIKNLSTDKVHSSKIARVLKTLFTGVPYARTGDITSFQVFPDYSSTTFTTSGHSCDQVLFYGKIISGQISENNNVEVYGHWDGKNNIIAKKIINKTSGALVKGAGVISCLVMWIILLFIVAAVSLIVVNLINIIIANIQLILFILAIIVALFILFQIIKFKYFGRRIIYKRWW